MTMHLGARVRAIGAVGLALLLGGCASTSPTTGVGAGVGAISTGYVGQEIGGAIAGTPGRIVGGLIGVVGGAVGGNALEAAFFQQPVQRNVEVEGDFSNVRREYAINPYDEDDVWVYPPKQNAYCYRVARDGRTFSAENQRSCPRG